MSEEIHFAHGNGFPSACYQQILQPLRAHFRCIDIDKIGHSLDFPVTENWHFLVQEIIHSIEAQATQPVIAIGHSLGGVLSLMAAIKQPELFKSLILLDSPLINPVKSYMVRLAKKFDFIDYITPAMRTRTRRKHWKTREEVLAYLKLRPLFSRFSPECLNDYVHFGLMKEKEGYSLRFDPEIEYQIYRTMPDDLNQWHGKLEIPTTLIYGRQSTVVNRIDRVYMRYGYGISSVAIEGSHMFPMEHPQLTVTQILRILGVHE